MAKLAEQRPEFAYVPQDKLRFDPTNPRFGGAGLAKTPDQIQDLLEKDPHFALELVDSFLENGFIDYEPLVVRRDGDDFIVVEGNRRLAAVRHILANRGEYEKKSTRVDDLLQIPVLVFPETASAQETKEQRVYLGVRHLFGFREWPAESKARFLDANIRNAAELERTLRELNIKKGDIRRYLVPYRLRKEARALWEPYRNQDFWVLGEGLSRSGIKEYVELDIDEDALTVDGYDDKKLRNLLHFIYGVPDGVKFVNRRIRETRELSTLARVLQNKKAAAVLERGGSLEEAALYMESPEESLSRLRRVVNELKVLLKGVLTRNRREHGAKDILARFETFERSVKKFIKNATKSSV